MLGKLKPQTQTPEASQFTEDERIAFTEVIGHYEQAHEKLTTHSKAAFMNCITDGMNKMKDDENIHDLTKGRTAFTTADLKRYFREMGHRFIDYYTRQPADQQRGGQQRGGQQRGGQQREGQQRGGQRGGGQRGRG
jgi:hypothetical protein